MTQQPGDQGQPDPSVPPGYQNQGYPPAPPGQPGYPPPPPTYSRPGYPPPPPYGQPYPMVAPTNTMAIMALIFAFVFAPLGIVFGFIGKGQIKQTGEQGDGLATAGIVVGAVFTVLFVLAIIFVFIAAATVVNTVLRITDVFPTGFPTPR